MTDILVDKQGPVAWVTLNRPDARNALSLDVNLKLAEIANELDFDDDVRALVITGAGDKAFCAGADLKERKGVPAGESAPFPQVVT